MEDDHALPLVGSIDSGSGSHELWDSERFRHGEATNTTHEAVYILVAYQRWIDWFWANGFVSSLPLDLTLSLDSHLCCSTLTTSRLFSFTTCWLQ